MQSLRVYYGALEVEFGIAPEAWVELPIDSGTAQVMKDGFRIVYDPEGRLRKALDCAQGVSWSGRGEHESGNHHRA